MPYTIRTKDGIVLQNIPDDVDPNSQELKDRVTQIRGGNAGQAKMVDDQRSKAMASMAMAGKSGFDKFVLGAGASANRMYEGLRGLVSDRERTPEEDALLSAGRELQGMSGAAKAGGIAMDVAPYLAAGVATGGMSAVPGVATRVGANALLDAGIGAALSPEDRGKEALLSGVGSAGGQLAGHALGRTLGGLVKPSADAQSLMRQGIQPTIGQGVDSSTLSGRALRDAEQAVETWPIVGTGVGAARRRSAQEFSQAALDRAVPPGGASREISREGIDAVGRQFDRAYSALDQLVFKPDVQFDKDLMKIVYNPDYFASAETPKNILSFIKKNFFQQFRNGPSSVGAYMPGKGLKEFESKLGQRIRDLARSTDKNDLAERRMLTAVDDALTQYRNRQIPAPLATQLSETDKAYAAWKRVARASKYSDDGAVTPSQLTRAVKAMSSGDAYGRGNAFMQDLTDAGAILRNKTPNSGTMDRAAWMGLALGAATAPAQLLPVGAGAVGLTAAYARPVQRFLLGGYRRQRALQEALRRNSQYAGDVAAGTATSD